MNTSQKIQCLLDSFWKWAELSNIQYSKLSSPNEIVEPFYFPHFSMLRDACRQQINCNLNSQELENFLTCMAIDSEEEIILDWCKDVGNLDFITLISSVGCYHQQPEARWQIAELLRCREIPKRNDFLKVLCSDDHNYVRKRANIAFQQTQHL